MKKIINIFALLLSLQVYANSTDNWGLTLSDYEDFKANIRISGVQPTLKEMRDELVNHIPMKLDGATVLTQATLSGNTLRLFYFVDVNKAVNDFNRTSEQKLTKQSYLYYLSNPNPYGYPEWCKGNPIYRILIEHGASLHSVVYDKQGGEVVVDSFLDTCN